MATWLLGESPPCCARGHAPSASTRGDFARGDKPGLFDIIDGGRRFQAAKAAELEQLKADLYDGTSDAAEIGAAANMMRAAMHPLDEAKVIARLAANGESLDSIGLRFGKGQRWVEQRRKLDRLSPKAKTLFREGRIDMAAAQTLTLGTKVQQEQYLAKAKDDWHYDASNIRRCLTAEAINAKYALFPLSDYPAKYIVRDIFSEDVRLSAHPRSSFSASTLPLDRLQKSLGGIVANLSAHLLANSRRETIVQAGINTRLSRLLLQ